MKRFFIALFICLIPFSARANTLLGIAKTLITLDPDFLVRIDDEIRPYVDPEDFEFMTENCDGFYACKNLDEKLSYLQKLPHIGKITANHLARNLGENIVKYDIWIQRLGVLYSGNSRLAQKIDNGKLDKEIKKCCDDMFNYLEHETRLPCGYIDVVLWKSAQNGLIKELKNECKD